MAGPRLPPPPPPGRLFAQCARAAVCAPPRRHRPLPGDVDDATRPSPDKCGGAGRRSASTGSALAFGRLVALRPAPEFSLLFTVPWRTGGSHTTVSAGPAGGTGRSGPRVGGAGLGRSPGAGGREGPASAGNGGGAGRGRGSPGGPAGLGWGEPELLTPESWRCEELRLGAGGSAVG